MTNDSKPQLYSPAAVALARTINSHTDVLWTSHSLSELLEAILAEFVVIPRADLPKQAPEAALEILTAAGFHDGSHTLPDPLVWVSKAVHCLDNWADEMVQKVAHQKRQEELAVELGEGNISQPRDYMSLSYEARRAIDRIIGLEEQAKA